MTLREQRRLLLRLRTHDPILRGTLEEALISPAALSLERLEWLARAVFDAASGPAQKRAARAVQATIRDLQTGLETRQEISRRLLELLGDGEAWEIGNLAAQVHMPLGMISRLLHGLVLRHKVVRTAGNRYLRASVSMKGD